MIKIEPIIAELGKNALYGAANYVGQRIVKSITEPKRTLFCERVTNKEIKCNNGYSYRKVY